MNDFFANMTWKCMICGDERPDAQISVAQRHGEGKWEGFIWNVRYCNDRTPCITSAHKPTGWAFGIPDVVEAPKKGKRKKRWFRKGKR